MNLLLVIGFTVAALESFMCLEVYGQGNLVLSNLEEPSDETFAVGNDAWLAQHFSLGRIDRSVWFLDSVQLSIGDVTGSPEGLSVAVYQDNGDLVDGPENLLAVLDGPSLPSDGVFIYSASPPVRLSAPFNWIVITAETPVAEGAYLLNLTSSPNFDSVQAWNWNESFFSSDDGITWTPGINERPLLAIHATRIPKLSIEPVMSGNQVEIRWHGVQNVRYQLQTRSSLTDDEWINIGEPIDGRDIGFVTALVSSSESQSYYRVEVLPAELPANE